MFLKDVCRQHPRRVIVAVDGKGPKVAIKGWTETVEEMVAEVGARAADAGAAALLYTDISRDGTGLGPNLEATAALAAGAGVPVIASGGIADLGDLVRLAAIPGVAGAIVGRALYTGAVDLRAAIIAVPA